MFYFSQNMTASLKFALPFVLLFTKSAAEGLIHFTYMNHVYQSGIRVLFQPEGDTNTDGQTTAQIKFSQFDTTCNQLLQTLPEDPWYNMIWSSQGKYYYLAIPTRTITTGQCIAYKTTLCRVGGCRIFYVGSKQYQVPSTIIYATDQELLDSREGFDSSTTTFTFAVTTTTTTTIATDTSTTVSTTTTTDDSGVTISFTYQNRRECTGLRVQYRLPEAETNGSSIPMIYINFRQLSTTCNQLTRSALTYWQLMSWNREGKYYYLNTDSPTLMPGYCIAYRILQCVAGEPCRTVGKITQFYDVPLNINSCTDSTLKASSISNAATNTPALTTTSTTTQVTTPSTIPTPTTTSTTPASITTTIRITTSNTMASTHVPDDDSGATISFTYQNMRECTGLRVQYHPSAAVDNEQSIPRVYIKLQQYYGSCKLWSYTLTRYSQAMSWNNEGKYFYITFEFSTLMPGQCIAYIITKCGGDMESCEDLNNQTQYYQVPPNINHCTATRTLPTIMKSTIIIKTATGQPKLQSTTKKLNESQQATLISLSVVGLGVIFIGITCSIALNIWTKKQRRARQSSHRDENTNGSQVDTAPSAPPLELLDIEDPEPMSCTCSQVDTAPSAPPLEMLDIEDLQPMSRTGTRNSIQNENNGTQDLYSQQRRSTTQPQNLPHSYHSEMLFSHSAQSIPIYPPPQFVRF